MKRQEKGGLIFRIIILNLEDINALSNTKILINVIFIFSYFQILIFMYGIPSLAIIPAMFLIWGNVSNIHGSHIWGLPPWLSDKESACNAGDAGLILQLGRSPENGNPFQYSCLKNPMGRGAWRLQSNELERVGHN